MASSLRTAKPVEVLPGPGLAARRSGQLGGLSRRRLLGRALGAGVGVLAIEWVAGTLGFAWSAVASVGGRVRVGSLDDLVASNPGLPIREGFPGYVPVARAFVVLVDPSIGGWRPGADATGDGTALNVRALSQRCPHLGCRPNPCVEDFWFHCPCHQSRYDRLGIKAAGERFGPAPRGMDRYAIEVDAAGSLTIDTGRITLSGRCQSRSDPRGSSRRGSSAAVHERLGVKGLLALYPRWWIDRYGDEMRSLLEVLPPRRRDRLDLARGALDAWLHPPTPSHVAGIAALVGGAAWTAVALGVVFQPVPPDWPGYLHESLPLAIIAACNLLVATLAVAVRAADAGGRALRLAVAVAMVGYVLWVAALVATAAGLADGVTLAVGQTVAMVGTVGIGVVVIRAKWEIVGTLLVVAGTSMLIPWTPAWLVFGACWTVAGVVLEFERFERPGSGLSIS